jgi:hypothetical protein
MAATVGGGGARGQFGIGFLKRAGLGSKAGMYVCPGSDGDGGHSPGLENLICKGLEMSVSTRGRLPDLLEVAVFG